MSQETMFAEVERLMGSWSLEAATRLLEGAKAQPGFPNRVHHDLSILYAQQGFFAEALREIEAAMAGDPSSRAVWHHFLALQKNNPAQPSPARWLAMHLAFGDTLAARDDRLYAPPRPRAGRKLRVGYVCPDTHLATARFVWPVFECFDASAFEVFGYWCHAGDTSQAAQAYPRARHRALPGMDDDAVAALVAADAIDILVDVAGHGAGNRLPVFASRPAPVRVTWLDYLATTGMAAMDFRITDATADPPGAEAAHVEQLLRLPVPQWCYRPPAHAQPEETREPRGTTFGSVCVPLKLSDPLLDLWAALLLRVPGSRLRLLGIPEGRARTRIVERFARSGVDTARIETVGRLSQDDFLAALARLDIVLDSHPFSGATSTLDALWQGVPVVTLAGPLSHGRSTESLLAALGRHDWIAATPERFVGIAASLAADGDRLARERRGLREALRASPICDGAAFMKAMEAAFGDAWAACASRDEPRLRDRAQAFWREAQAAAKTPHDTPRVAVGALQGWTLVTAERHYDGALVPLEVPAAALDRFDVLGALGASEMPNGDLLAAGAGHVRGASLIGAGERLFCAVFLPDGFGDCVALGGTALLVRSEMLAGLALPDGEALDEPAYRCALTRLSCELKRKGARLGVSVALAIPDRNAELDPRAEYAAHRALEAELGLERWGQRRAAAFPLKAALPLAAWQRLLPVLERRCDSWPGDPS